MKLKKLLLYAIPIILIVLSTIVYGDMTYSVKSKPNSAWWSGSSRDIAWRWAKEVEDKVDVGGFVFTPRTEPTGEEGLLYYDSGSNTLKYYNGAAFVELGTTAAGASLDGGYDVGAGITVDAGAVTLTATNAANNTALAIVQSDTATAKAMTITNAGTGNSIDIQGQGSAKDIEGTDDSWNISTAGKLTCVGVDTTGTLIMENDDIISNATNDTFLFNTGDEDLLLDFTTGTNTITLGSNSTGGTTIALGDYSTITGISALTGLAADFTISTTGDATGEDLILQQAGTGDNQVQVLSAGTEADAILLNSTVGGTTVTSATSIIGTSAAGVITWESTGGDILLDATDKSIKLDSGEAAADDAIVIVTTGAGSGIQITSLADIDITTTGASGEDITITNTGGSIAISATESAADAVTISAAGAAGGVTLSSGTGDITLDSGDDIFLAADTGTGDVISIINTQGTAAGATILRSTAGGVDIDAAAALDVDIAGGQVLISSKDDAASAIALTANVGTSETIVVTNTQGTSESAITLASTAGGVNVDAAAAKDLDLAGGQVKLVSKDNAAGAISLTTNIGSSETITITNTQGTAAGAIALASSAGGTTITAVGATAGDIALTAGDDITIAPTGKLALTLGEESTYKGIFIPDSLVKKTITSGSLTSADCGYLLQVSADAQTIVLPATAAGLTFWIMNTAADGGALLTIDCDNVDKFIGAGLAPADGEAILNTKLTAHMGDYIKVTAHTDGWIITEMNGTWAEASP